MKQMGLASDGFNISSGFALHGTVAGQVAGLRLGWACVPLGWSVGWEEGHVSFLLATSSPIQAEICPWLRDCICA